jgi:nucleotide-binding universal stress UspA family protein
MITGHEPVRRIVVGVDGSEPSRWALRWAAALAGPETRLQAVTVWHYPENYALSTRGTGPWRPDEVAAEKLETTLDEVFADDRPARLETVVREGHPAAVLVAASTDADLLVVGSRGHGGFAAVLLGSVSARCAEQAACAVLVAHRPPA